ncbi:GNAT family N-acetyltransferase [Paenibacillus sp. CAA11]|uniref:GNAT family N-acetyltransferase n=1 Tax=Paenibacillus sp. CAA11 TaxID=1532905 RepID=UPI00131F3F7A|nr:GNAT family N-acetyltransferase [Paenibacillus sp. CAA11]
MPKHVIRNLRPEDYGAVAKLLNTILSEPTTAEMLKDEEDKIPPGKLHYSEEGMLLGWDRPKWVVENEQDQIIAYAIAWRAPWAEPGELAFTLVVDPDRCSEGVGTALYNTIHHWAEEVRASRLVTSIRESDSRALTFAQQREYVQERHLFESVLDLSSFDGEPLYQSIEEAKQKGIQFTTLAEEPGEPNERKLHELYEITSKDIPGYSGSYPWFEEWKKWSIEQNGVRPEWIHIAKDGDRYIGVATLQQNEQTRAMYHEFTGVHPEYRGRHIALALKMLAIRTAQAYGVPYLRTHNDSLNGPMLRVNRDLLGFTGEPGLFKMVRELS